MSYEYIVYEQTGPVARILHNRPQARNAESRGLLEEMNSALARAVADDAVRVVVIGAVGEHFSAGHDLKEAQRERSNFTVEERWAFEERCYYGYALNIYDCPKPTIAEVPGACIAAGFMVANLCDLIVAAEDAFFSDPVGHTLGAAGVEVLIHPWVLGARKAKEMLFTGERIGAEEGHRLGMVNRVVPRERLREETQELAERIAEADPFALRLIKRSVNRALDIQGLRAALNAHFDTHQLSHLSGGFEKARESGLSGAIGAARDAAKKG